MAAIETSTAGSGKHAAAGSASAPSVPGLPITAPQQPSSGKAHAAHGSVGKAAPGAVALGAGNGAVDVAATDAECDALAKVRACVGPAG
eukprot:165073-Chlamydomonas_euryale.AAC.1